MNMRLDARQSLAVGATAGTVILTAVAFWLSYEHLHTVAVGNGMSGVQAWAWPATIDLFVVIGELLLLRSLLAGRGVDWFAFGLTVIGSAGSIALNVAGVGASAPRLAYVVAAVPPVAALFAFAALMRQVHERLAVPAEETKMYNVHLDPAADLERVLAPEVEPEYAYPQLPAAVPQAVPAGVRLLPIVARPAAAVLAAEAPRTRSEVRAEYVPDAVLAEEVQASTEGLDVIQTLAEKPEDELTEEARKEYAEVLAAGRMPSYQDLKTRFSIGQPRAARIRDQLQRA